MFGIQGLTPDIVLVLGIILTTIILFVLETVRVDVVACLVLVLLGLTKLVPANLLFSGFSSDAVIALIGVMIMSAGLERSGVISKITEALVRFGAGHETKIRIYLMCISGIGSGFLRSVGVVSLILPVIMRIRFATGIDKRRLLLPVSFCAILGSTMTMIGSGPLIILNSLLINSKGLTDQFGQDTSSLGLFTVLPIGVLLLTVGILYFVYLDKFVLPRAKNEPVTKHGGSSNYFKKIYGIGADFCECRVPSTSPLVDNTLRQWESLLPPSIAILGVKVGDNLHTPALRKTVIVSGSVVAMLGPQAEVQEFASKYGLRLSPYLTAFASKLNSAHAGLCEAVVPPSSQLIGRDLRDLHMRHHYGIQVLAVHRSDKVRRGKTEIGNLTLRPGDTLGMFCNWSALAQLQKNPDFVVVTTDYPKRHLNVDKMGLAVLFFFLAMALILFAGFSVPIGLLVGAVCMIFSGVISIDDAYEAVSWKTVFLLAGLIPLGIAIQNSGTSDWFSARIIGLLWNKSEWVLLLFLGVVATIGGFVLTNVGATIVLVPLAVHLAHAIGADPRSLALMVAVASSNSFLIPTHQANALITLPGKYEIIDFIRAGGLMTVLYLLIVMGMCLLLF